MTTGLQIYNTQGAIILDSTEAMVNLGGVFEIPRYIFATTNIDGSTHTGMNRVLTGTFTHSSLGKGTPIVVPSMTNTGSIAEKPTSAWTDMGDRSTQMPDFTFSGNTVTWSIDCTRSGATGDFSAFTVGGFIVYVGFY